MFKKVLVPLDGSELAERALDPALTIARATSAELLLLSVPSYPQVVPPAAGYGVVTTDSIIDLGHDDVEGGHVAGPVNGPHIVLQCAFLSKVSSG